MSKPIIGFIGLGLMGRAMCDHMQDERYSLNVMANRSREAVEAAVAKGATECATPKEIAENSDIVMLCVDTSQSVEGRMYGDDGVIAGLSEGKVVIDFGTSLPSSTTKIGGDVQAVGGYYLDSPIGRTPAHARDGLLNLMCSGSKEGYDKAEGILKVLGENVFYLGNLGSGHTIKLINNFFGMTVANAMAEAFAMADKMGVDRQQLYDVMSAGPLHSGMMDFVKGYAVDNDPSMLAFAIKNAAKDVGYYSQMSKDAGADSIMSKSTLNALETARDDGMGDEMVSQMFDFYKKSFG
ncbi:MAG: NAD(P)-dependent oxidoreductase [Rhizobiaceae bacterium]|nr:NAD(P)-dependent oxidoreductase [Rhizobiaceae bacterium]